MEYLSNQLPPDDPYDNKDWKLKKKKILIRDNFECQKCSNRTLIEKSIKGKILKVSEQLNLLGLVNKSNDLFYRHGYSISFLDDLGKEHNQNVLSHVKLTALDKFIDHVIYLYPIRGKTQKKGLLMDSVNIQVTDTIITCIENPYSKSKKDHWFYVRNLHVHHINYPDDENIANVPDKDLVTLCARCHQNLHKNRQLAGDCD